MKIDWEELAEAGAGDVREWGASARFLTGRLVTGPARWFSVQREVLVGGKPTPRTLRKVLWNWRDFRFSDGAAVVLVYNTETGLTRLGLGLIFRSRRQAHAKGYPVLDLETMEEDIGDPQVS